MAEFKFLVRIPMDAWRQMVRHRTASINEYSTRYSEAIDSAQTTGVDEWRLQSGNNKQGSSGYLEKWPDEVPISLHGHACCMSPHRTGTSTAIGARTYEERIAMGVAREHARKDLPLSTYTEAY